MVKWEPYLNRQTALTNSCSSAVLSLFNGAIEQETGEECVCSKKENFLLGRFHTCSHQLALEFREYFRFVYMGRFIARF